jgi:ubiquinone/menaquinone biosynthesis C-methylase UbiE
MVKRLALLGVFITAALTWIVIARAQDNAADATRLVDVLQLDAGDVVAEIGAGNGGLSIAIAKHVGPSGRVYTSELPNNLERLRSAIGKSDLGNIQVIEARLEETNLPEACCDAIFMRNVYHHFTAPPKMNSSFLRSLKPGGRLAIIDFSPRGKPASAPDKRGDDSSHGVAAETVANELKAAGFEVTTTEARSGRWFLVAALKPGKSPAP